MHLKMLSTFQDWPAAGTVTTDGEAEQNRCARNVYGSEYFIQAFSFVSFLFARDFLCASSFSYY